MHRRLISPMEPYLLSRRRLLASLAIGVPALLSMAATTKMPEHSLQRRLDELEHRHGGRLGVAIYNSANHKMVAHRGHERFALCSTFKLLAATLVLARVDRDEEQLDRRVYYTKEFLVAHSPVTERHAGADGMTMAEICKAALTLSDNTAGNLMLDSFGGPATLRAYLSTRGDHVTRLDRRETELNENRRGDLRDTTTPIAMLETMRGIFLGDALSETSRKRLVNWISENTTGDNRLRAGIPKSWHVGDKTGSGDHNATNDVAVIWPPGKAPILVTVYYSEAHASETERNAVIAEVGKLASTL